METISSETGWSNHLLAKGGEHSGRGVKVAKGRDSSKERLDKLSVQHSSRWKLTWEVVCENRIVE